MFNSKIILILCLVGFLNANGLIENYETGSINWSEQIVTAKGLGYSKKANKTIAYKMAQRASKLDAMRNLLEIVGKVRINSTTTVENKMAQNDIVKSEISGYIRNIIDIKYNKIDDNTVESIVKMKLKDNILNNIVNNSFSNKNSDLFKGKKATGLIIDARGLNFIPSLNPKLIQEFEGVLYPDKIFQKPSGSNKFVAQYLRDINIAMKHPLVGKFPLVVKAKGIYDNKNDQLLLNSEQSNKVKQEVQIEALQNGKVIIIIK